MFAPKAAAPATGGLSLNTNSTSSLFGGNTATSSANPGATTTSSLFGNPASSTAPKSTGGLFGTPAAGTTTQAQPTGSNMFGGQQQSGATGSSLFGGANTTTPPSGTSNLFGGSTAGAGTSTTQGATGGGLLGSTLFNSSSTAQTQKPAFTGLGAVGAGSGLTGGLAGGATGGMFGQSTAQQQQSQKPTLSLFGQPAPAQTTQPLQQSTATSTVIQGVKVDVSNLLPTTKFESCADEIRSQIEAIDKHILNQMKMCHEVGDLLPTIEKQGATIPNDVEFVQGKLETMQHALENDASDIDGLRSLVARDAAEAQVAFRAIDTLKLPLQYQSTGGGWWSVQDQQIPERSMRSSRKNTLALPDGVEGDASTDVNGIPVNLVDYFSHRSKEMKGVLTKYTGNLKEIEDHLHGVEATLNRQISDFVSSKSREGAAGTPRSTINELSGVLSDVEAGIMGVATRLSNVSEQVQDLSIGQQALGDGRFHLG
ncbi:Nucleoporin NUP49/NSP49, putative [Penicillium digitatum]|uniref:Nucleoporin NUP49/NSP49, putative n=3 Tax=Penicillium digitatum TaxID=36651 RepID=K9GY77_PEND2|nr:Nucleoporin NUP49/NSP49, putative [Penicillium digitatum Pd1]EKV15826.1 Nucleoporin NUP49/NSP49, putative [Penicillium digitatum Pd1]EKV17891.1 Nucleoporin NUP49/NSP49, putative [Penicillium digitatum PHI26]QQK42306.1 Nucleoporin NUP49/NSP49, putative [Penicillium digitatum]